MVDLLGAQVGEGGRVLGFDLKPIDISLPAWAEGTQLPWEQVASRSSAFLEARVGGGVEP